MMRVRFRNVEVDPQASIQTWPYEALVTIIERGSVKDWALLRDAIDDQPWGPVACAVEDYLSYAQPWGVGVLLRRTLESARAGE